MTIAVGDRAYLAALRDDGTIGIVVGDVEVGEMETVEVDGERVELTAVSVGNPHAVVRAEPDRDELLRLGPQLEANERFPERTNVQLVRVDGPHDVTVAVWERGSGGDERLGLERRRRRVCRDRERLVRDPRHGADARRRAPRRTGRRGADHPRRSGRADLRGRAAALDGELELSERLVQAEPLVVGGSCASR